MALRDPKEVVRELTTDIATKLSISNKDSASDSTEKPKPKDTEKSNPKEDTEKSEFDVYDDVEIEDMDFDESSETYFYPCPCGDKFRITKEALIDGEEIATCPSCSLRIRVIYNADDFKREESEPEDED